MLFSLLLPFSRKLSFSFLFQMVRVWYMDTDVKSDQRLEHHRTPKEYLDLQTLNKLTGVEYFNVRDFQVHFFPRCLVEGTLEQFVTAKVLSSRNRRIGTNLTCLE
jgi:hypothetical protein